MLDRSTMIADSIASLEYWAQFCIIRNETPKVMVAVS